MKVTVFGASGLIGQHLIEELSKDPKVEVIFQVLRKPGEKKYEKVESIIWDGKVFPESIYHVDCIFCCLGTTIKKAKTEEAFKAIDYQLPLMIAKQFKSLGGEKYLVVSAQGADDKSKIFYNRVKGELERDLKKIAFKKLVIVRPSLLLGDRNESRPGEHLAQKLSPLLSPLLFGPMAKYRPIKATKVAKDLLDLSQDKKPSTPMEYIIVEK